MDRETKRVFNLKAKGEDRCRNCGREATDPHHALPRSLCPAAKKDLRNCLPLCRSCHSSWHRRGKTIIYRDRFTREEWDYLLSCDIGRNIEAWLDERYPDRGLPFRGEDADAEVAA